MHISRLISGIFRFLFLAALIFNISGCKEKNQIPIEILFGNPEKATAQISPDGKSLAYVAPLKGVLNIWVKSIEASDDRAVTHDQDRGVTNFLWAADGKRIFYAQDVLGNENTHLFEIDLNTGISKDLTFFENIQARVIDYNKDFPNEMLIAVNKRDPHFHDVYRLDLIGRNLKLVSENPGKITEWYADSKMKIRGALQVSQKGGFDLLVRPDEKSPWEAIVYWSLEDEMQSGFLSFSKDGEFIYLKDSRNVDKSRLVKLEIKTGKIEVLAEDPDYDIEEVLLDPDLYVIDAVSFYEERKLWKVLNSTVKDDFARIRGLHSGDFSITSRDYSNRKWVLRFVQDNAAVSYFLYDRPSKKATHLFDHQSALGKYLLAEMKPVEFLSRDGLRLYGYLTLPPNKRPLNLPLVLMVHGGPWTRDVWGFDPKVQWLANRGYACLQVNFRGSTGYGKAFVNAGDRQWGAKMQDDLTDAAEWAVNEKIADRNRIAIFGGSYGGYAALAGAAFTPKVFRCAVSLMGPSNLITFLKTTPPYWSNYLQMIHKRVGDPDLEPDFLKSRSPLFHVDQIKVPVLIAQGANDPRVNIAEADQIVRAMKEKKIKFEYLIFSDEGHGLAKPVNRLDLFKRIEVFLARNLKKN